VRFAVSATPGFTKFPFLKDYGIKGKYAAMECLGKLPKPDLTNVTFLPGPRLEDDPEGAV
jgi:hypothetical protein